MSKLDTVKRKLKGMGIDFTYEVDAENSKSTISFVDALGDSHKLIEHIDSWNGRMTTELRLDKGYMNNQVDVCNWLDEHKELLTNAETYKEMQRAKEAHRAKMKRLTQRKKFTFTSGNYELSVIKNLLGNISYRIATLDHPEYEIDYSPRLEVKFEGSSYEENPIVVITTGGYHGFDVAQARYLQQALTGAIEATETFQKIVDRESKIPLTEAD